MFLYDIAIKYIKSDFLTDLLNISFLSIDLFLQHPS